MVNSPSGLPAAEKAVLAALVDYQPGTVVSRTLLKQAGGNLTLFAFAEGQELSEHTAPYDALVSVLDGQARILIEGRPFDLKTGDAILMPAHRPHAVQAPQNFKMLLIMLNG